MEASVDLIGCEKPPKKIKTSINYNCLTLEFNCSSTPVEVFVQSLKEKVTGNLDIDYQAISEAGEYWFSYQFKRQQDSILLETSSNGNLPNRFTAKQVDAKLSDYSEKARFLNYLNNILELNVLTDTWPEEMNLFKRMQKISC